MIKADPQVRRHLAPAILHGVKAKRHTVTISGVRIGRFKEELPTHWNDSGSDMHKAGRPYIGRSLGEKAEALNAVRQYLHEQIRSALKAPPVDQDSYAMRSCGWSGIGLQECAARGSPSITRASTWLDVYGSGKIRLCWELS